jgi:hypothetical protein
MTRVQFAAVTAVLAFLLPTDSALSDETPPYGWTCKSQGFFGTDVSPDGKPAPVVDTSLIGPVSIVIKARSSEIKVERPYPMSAVFPLDDRYAVGFTSESGTVFDGKLDDMEASGAHLRFENNALTRVSAIYFRGDYPSILTLEKADKDWVFSVYSGELTSDAEARHLNITSSSVRPRSEAKASIFFMTGPCVRTR